VEKGKAMDFTMALVGAGGFEPLSAQPLTDPNGQKKKAIDFAMAFL
jgi:hypothetical protein